MCFACFSVYHLVSSFALLFILIVFPQLQEKLYLLCGVYPWRGSALDGKNSSSAQFCLPRMLTFRCYDMFTSIVWGNVCCIINYLKFFLYIKVVGFHAWFMLWLIRKQVECVIAQCFGACK